jgi:hypothetical protein
MRRRMSTSPGPGRFARVDAFLTSLGPLTIRQRPGTPRDTVRTATGFATFDGQLDATAAVMARFESAPLT